jgi:anti-sigma regulatory factor (Ser/Thr protein kinase)
MFYSESLPKSPTSASTARELLGRLGGDVSEAKLDDARLLTSELVANAVEHVREEGEIEVRVTLDDRVLRVEVRDPGPGFTYVPRADGAKGSDRGWGLVFADRLASRWANEPGLVWFELDRS